MDKIGVFYSFHTIKTRQQVQILVKAFGADNIEEVNVENANSSDFKKFKYFIFGVPTWFDGELPNYWDEFLPSLDEEEFKEKYFAIFGGGDQKKYPENFVDGIGILGKYIKNRGGNLLGYTPIEGYEFEASQAQDENYFMGLPLDIENQAAMTEERIKNWVSQLMKEFK